MVSVTNQKPCKLVYSLYQHEYLGYLIEPHVVQLTEKGHYSLAHQKLYSVKAEEYEEFLDEKDFKLIKMLEECDQEFIVKKYHKKPIRPHEFFLEHYNEALHKVIRPNIERRLQQALMIMAEEEKLFYVMSDDGNPVHEEVAFEQNTAQVLFHFFKNENSTHYFPTIKLGDEKIEFRNKNAIVVCENPAWLLLEGRMIRFEGNLDGKKLKPFINKKFIEIPKESEPAYYKKFIAPLIEKYNVHAEGFDIRSEQLFASPVLKIENTWDNRHQLVLYFKYGEYSFPYNSGSRASVRLEQNGDAYIFHKVKRALDWEEHKINKLIELGLRPGEGSGFLLSASTSQLVDVENPNPDYPLIEWLCENFDQLQKAGIEICQKNREQKVYVGTTALEIQIKESSDWFDVHAMVRFGEFEVPFIQLRGHILSGKREYKLPNGEMAVIPEKWFEQFNPLFEFSDGGKELRLKKYHFALVKELEESRLAKVSLEHRLQKVNNAEVSAIPLSKGFNGTLREYQKEGYYWFNYLREQNFGGCLADDMGLGKTIQTLALLDKIREDFKPNGVPRLTTVIIMPTSLIYNWQNEAKKFTPHLKVFAHVGTYRDKKTEHFRNYDVILTTYGTVRLDVEFLKEFGFHYVILDESQVIKNPSSKIARAVKKLRADHKLVLSGTPIENSVFDLWSQMAFINPGLLGTQAYFKENYAVPIEKKKDLAKIDHLQKVIRPFLLRRTKNQVATELPEKMEHVFYSLMSEEQQDLYDETKNYYRNLLLNEITENGMAKSQISILQGLTRLRQLANHPRMVDFDSKASSGKFKDVTHNIDALVEKGHKILVFSQFVKHLAVFKEHLEKEKVPFAYLDGSTKNRQAEIERFKSDPKIQVFLISIKAGGVGLNLTEADYVFILDPWWNPAVEQQAIDRTHRIGQNKNVFIYKFISKGTVEEKILALQNRKKKLANSLISAEDALLKSLTEEDIREILA